MPSPGEIVGGRYRLDERIAAGGMGEVWQATDTVLGRDVAVKTLHADRAGDPGFQERFRHEARSMAALHHPGVADVYDFGETGDGTDAYIVMARIEGEPLNGRIAAEGRLTPEETMSVVAQAARALEAAHEAGIVHRDVKPSNLIIKPDGTVVLVDFGVARSAHSSTLTGAREVVGTAMYIAPEQVSKAETGPPADQYALGVVAYHCLAGHAPFLGDNPIAIALQHVNDPPPDLPEDVPPAVRALVLRAMAKNPEDRFPTAAAMAEAADRAVSGGDTTAVLAAPRYGAGVAPTPSTLPEPARTSGPRRGVVVLAGAGVLVLAGAVAAVALLVDRGNDRTPGTTPPSQSAPGSVVGTGDAPKPGTTTRRTRTPTTRPTTKPAPPVDQPSDPASEVPSGPVSSEPEDPDGGGSTEPEDPGTSADPAPGGENGGGNEGPGNEGPGGGGNEEETEAGAGEGAPPAGTSVG